MIEVERADYADKEKQAALLEQLYEELGKKRRIKEQVKAERHRQPAPASLIAPEAIPIRVLDEGEFIHYPASPDDLRAIMNLLPKGVINGISSIDLCLGAEYIAENCDDRDPDPDPLTGRLSSESQPGVYRGHILGTYSPSSARIRIFADVYKPDLPQREMWEFYFRLRMLSVFVHEVAHHFDNTKRIARGRWLADTEEKNEIFAEHIEHKWTQEYVVPYLEKTYPHELRLLNEWFEYHAGILLPLATLAGDARTTIKGGKIRIAGLFGISGAIESLVEEVANGNDVIQTRLQFARELHWGEYYAEALAIIEQVLQESNDNLEALTLQADIYEHQERYSEARALAEKVIAIDAKYLDAWLVLADVYEAEKNWLLLAETATQAAALSSQYKHRWARILRQRILAKIELGDLAGAEADINEYSQGASAYTLKQLEKLRDELNSRKQQLAD